jgi:hypothetical protein
MCQDQSGMKKNMHGGQGLRNRKRHVLLGTMADARGTLLVANACARWIAETDDKVIFVLASWEHQVNKNKEYK